MSFNSIAAEREREREREGVCVLLCQGNLGNLK